ncbi:TetR/AcrR family transcriptional regulator [Marinospirillum alkaliphilum]|uniref:Transcriptional regulator, TetR family n=1 Tax=Marinospirillum alkaliphilum DSM 21637 TaxID=1122209 RepID=A0A1K1XPE8_9GAMM|nr:TetR/AcrR family transcriptional regulator [Marinospirillum alkaliphilum]SFX50948.1 transcriptional regulator, TetR family [Marinospirillum alkaliphilum DSM 21637]
MLPSQDWYFRPNDRLRSVQINAAGFSNLLHFADVQFQSKRYYSVKSDSSLAVSASCQDKRQQIILAASEAFLQKGYQNSSMEAIAAQAGVAKQTLYNHFGNKDALFFAVVNQMCAVEDDHLRSNEITSKNVEAVLQQYARRKLADLTSAENTAMFRMMVSEAIRFPNLGQFFFQAGMEKDRQLLVDFLTRQHEAGNLQVDDPEQAALFFQGALNAYFRPKFIMTGEAPSEAAIQQHIDYCIAKFLQLYRLTP